MGPDEQLVQAQDAGVLLGLMASAPLPPMVTSVRRGRTPTPRCSPTIHDQESLTSLLTPELLRTALRAAGSGLDYEGLKIAICPPDASLDRRLALVSRMLMELQQTSQ